MTLNEPKVITMESITPIFIGNGETAKPISFVRGRDRLHLLNFDNLLRHLSQEKQQAYVDWVDSLTDRLSTLRKKTMAARNDSGLKSKLKKERQIIEREFSIETFIRTCLGSDALRFIQSQNLISYSIPFTVLPGINGFKLCLKNAQGQPYIPGSEIKGALRTSLLSALLLQEVHYDVLKRRIEDFRKVFRSGISLKDKMEELRGISPSFEGEMLRGKKKDAKFDLFKFVQVSDSTPTSVGILRVEVTQSLGSRRYTTFIETIGKNRKLSFQIYTPERLRSSDRWFLKKLGLDKEYLVRALDIDMLLEANYLRSKTILEEEEKYSYPASIRHQIKELKSLIRGTLHCYA